MEEKALAGLKVLEYADLVSGPYCGKMLADLGAEVIKIERPGSGDRSRQLGPFPDDIPHPERSGLFLCLNANKLSITLNLEVTTGLGIFKELVKEADILLENNPPKTMESLGLSYPSLEEINPKLIMTSITPFGQTGPYRDYSAYDINIWHSGGLAYGMGDPDKAPLNSAGFLADYQSALNAFLATLCALIFRQAKGQGQHVDVSGQECIASILEFGITSYTFQGKILRRLGTPHVPLGLEKIIFPCKDGFVAMLLLEPHQWQAMVEMMGNPPWAMDPKLSNFFYRMTPEGQEEVKRKYGKDINELIEEWLSQQEKEAFFHEAQKRRIPAAPVYSPKEMMESRHLRERNFFVEIPHPQAGTLTYPGAPYRFSRTPWRMERPAPLLGEHNEEIYCGRLGYSREELVKLRQAGVI